MSSDLQVRVARLINIVSFSRTAMCGQVRCCEGWAMNCNALRDGLCLGTL